MPGRIQLSKEQRRCLLEPNYLPHSVSIKSRTYTPERAIKAGFKGAIWSVKDDFGRRRALKLCIYEDYRNRSYLQEMARASALDQYQEFALFVDTGLIELKLGPLPKQRFVCFVEEWIDGLTLEDFINKQKDVVTAAFLVAYVKGMCRGLNALNKVGLRHDDLHAGNVMLAQPMPGDLPAEWKIKIVDTGSMKPATSAVTKPKDDHRNFVDHLVLLWNAVHACKITAIRDRRFLTEALRLLKSMLDDDPSIALRDPVQIIQQFDLAYTRSGPSRLTEEKYLEPKDPFEFISAEHIADDRLLVSMFARSCPFLEKVDGPDPCLVTGPRGCGKSTIFRWLSLKAHLHQPVSVIDSFQIAGFYISCSSDLQNRLGWIRTEALANKFRREIVHYFNLLLAREVVQTLSLIAAREDRDSYWGFGAIQEENVCRFVLEALGPSSSPRIQGVSRLVQVGESIEAEMFSTHSKMLSELNIASFTGDAFLGDLTTLLARQISYFAKKRIAFWSMISLHIGCPMMYRKS